MTSALIRSAALAVLLAASATACSPIESTHGFIADTPAVLNVQVGVDTRATVLQRLGTPTTTAAFDQTSWYYISSTEHRTAFFRPRTAEREVLVVRFDANDLVTAADRYGVERGRIIAYNEDATPTRGRELGLLEQIFGNVGSTPPIRAGDDEQNNPRRRN